MGKSNTSKKDAVRYLRLYAQRRKVGFWMTLLSALLFIVMCMVAGTNMAEKGWMVYASLGLYIICFVAYRIFCQCPYCGKSIMRNFKKLTHCPYCKRPIKETMAPKTTGKPVKLK